MGTLIDRIIAASLRHRLVVVIATLVLAVAGLWAFATLNTDAFPDLKAYELVYKYGAVLQYLGPIPGDVLTAGSDPWAKRWMWIAAGCVGLVVLLYVSFYLMLDSGAGNLEAIARRLL